MDLSPVKIRENSEISCEPTKPFEAVPVTQKTRELVKKFKEQAKSFGLKRNIKKSKTRFRPIISKNWVKSDNGSVTDTSSRCN